ncbi:MAG: hypothetical protein JXR73_06790, partial [Candidatus Omnitrophica bacterium]|nr:hypothetical protein [Candidatus Omnitrophota bacterium]
MLYKNRILKLTTISVMALALAFLPWGAQAQDAGDCIPNGAYSGGFADGQFAGLFWNFVITMHDPEGSRGSVNFNWCTNRIDLFPTHEEYAPMVGDLVRTGPNTWDMTVIGNGADGPVGTGANNLLFISVMSGSCTFSENCDEMYYSGAYAVFQPYQDVNPTDGIPDEGEEPYICFPAESVSHRVKVMPPYALKMPTGPTSVMGDVWVTDDMQSTQNLAGGVDEDVAADRALAVRWYLGGMDCKSYHIYVSDDGAPFAYLCHT